MARQSTYGNMPNLTATLQSIWRRVADRLARLGIPKKTIDQRLIGPAAGLLAVLPGRAGLFFDQVADQTRRGDRVANTLEAFESDLAGLGSDAICIDLGANVGIMTEKLAARAGTVHAFEPDPAAFAALRDRVGHLPNVVLHNVAVGTADTTVQLMRAAEADANTRLTVGSSILAAPEFEASDAVEVTCVDFVRFLRELGAPVALVKMDIEGAEIGVLGALLAAPERDRIGAIYVETHAWRYPEQLVPLARLRRAYAALARPRVDFYWP